VFLQHISEKYGVVISASTVHALIYDVTTNKEQLYEHDIFATVDGWRCALTYTCVRGHANAAGFFRSLRLATSATSKSVPVSYLCSKNTCEYAS